MTAARLRQLALPLFALTWGASVASAENTQGEYLALEDGALKVTHSLSYSFTTPSGFTVHPPSHRTDRFNDVPFNISLAAFTSADAAIMVHAEQVANASGASNYDRLPLTNWPVDGFRGEARACHDIPASIVAEEHDLNWLRQRGFEPSGSIWFEQHFLSGNGYNDEIVVSLLVKGPACDDGDAADRALASLRATLVVSPHQN